MLVLHFHMLKIQLISTHVTRSYVQNPMSTFTWGDGYMGTVERVEWATKNLRWSAFDWIFF